MSAKLRVFNFKDDEIHARYWVINVRIQKKTPDQKYFLYFGIGRKELKFNKRNSIFKIHKSKKIFFFSSCNRRVLVPSSTFHLALGRSVTLLIVICSSMSSFGNRTLFTLSGWDQTIEVRWGQSRGQTKSLCLVSIPAFLAHRWTG